MWASDVSSAANLAEIAGEDALGEIFAEGRIHANSPSASGRMAMAVYGALSSAGFATNVCCYFAEWWSNDGGDLVPVPDGTDPEDISMPAAEPGLSHWI